ncbi:MAG: alpha/beta hydrolase [Bacteroidota bacterium]|nr:alpha/beta hydrolase [Bacteroidota bacterium]
MKQSGNINPIKLFFEMSLRKSKYLGPLICVIIISCNQNKQPQQAKAQASSIEHTQLPIWSKSIPDSGLITGSETDNDGMVTNVSNPTITLYSPKGKNTGVAVVVFPGGGYRALAIELEGSEICEWLASIGVTGILLKYRVPDSGPHWDKDCKCHKDAVKPLALEDAQRAMGLVRFHSKEWNIDPRKIGVIGFSAGGHLVADVSTHYEKRSYPVMDEADKISCRPDFGMAIYPGHMLEHTTKDYELNPTIPVNSNTPPTFLLQAGNDPVDTIQNSLVYYVALKKAGVPAEYHIYAEGEHAFGLKKSNLPINDWPKLAETWLHTIKMISN